MEEKNKTIYIQIVMSVLPVIVTISGGFISISNQITSLTTQISSLKEELKSSQVNIQKDLAVRDGRLDRLETRLDAVTQKAYPNIKE